MSTRSAEISGTTTTDPESLVAALNSLLAALSLEQITLETPQDLTPSLLLAMLESMLRARLPIPQQTRAAAGVGAMKVFLGVLEADVMQQDVGLADVHPRRLADGEWAECVFVGELLVWLARDMGYLPVDAEQRENWEEPAEQRAESSSMASLRAETTTTVTRKRPPMHAHKDSVTSMRTADSNPFVVRPSRPRRSPQRDASTGYAARDASTICGARDASTSYAPRDASTSYARRDASAGHAPHDASLIYAPRESPTRSAPRESPTNYNYASPTNSSPHHSYTPPSPIPSSHPSRTPSPTTDSLGLGLSFHPLRASSPARFDEDEESDVEQKFEEEDALDERDQDGLDEVDEDDTQLCTCDLDADADPDATFCTCDGHTTDLPPPPRRGSTPLAATYATAGRRTSLPADARPSLGATDRRSSPGATDRPSPGIPLATGNRRPSLAHDPAQTTTTPVRYDGWIERVEGDVEAFEAARARATRRPTSARSHDRATPGPSRAGAALGAARTPHPTAGVGLGPPRASAGAGVGIARNPTRHVSPAQHTLALMHERARLLGELAKIRTRG